MITTANLKDTLVAVGYAETSAGIFTKQYPHFDFCELRVDFNTHKIIYPGKVTLGDTTTSNFEHPENYVVLECVTRLMDKGYRPEHLELEKRWQLGRGASGGKADIIVKNENGDGVLLIIECKTAGREYTEALKKTREDGGQLFSYWQQEKSTKWLALYASDFKESQVRHDITIIKCEDDANILKMAHKDKSVLTYEKAHTVEELAEVWEETYGQQVVQNDIIFGLDTQAYKVGILPLRKKDLQDFKPEDKIVNRFEEILRHNNVSDKENAFNRLIALFICKLVDEIKKNDYDEVDFQYKVGTDTYESLQDRLQRLHKIGMQEFMQEEINYVDDEYADRVFGQLAQGKRKNAIADLRNTIRILKYYTNNDFTFKDVHNEELFYQNGKVLVEVVQLFEKYRIVYAAKHQFLGDLFEQLLNKGFKQNEGQFFTPMPITRFIWDCLPLDKILHEENEYHLPKVIDYACGAGHFLTEAVEAINTYFHQKQNDEQVEENTWVEKNIFGIEKDYRLARVAKVSLYMNGAGKGQIVFGDGLEQYPEKGIVNGTFDILVANPPYSVDAFKAHLKLKNNEFEILPLVSNNGSEIETVFVERIAQLLKPKGVAAVLLPSSILSNDSETYIAAREQILKHFYLRAIVQLGSKTFGATNTNTVILFMEKYNEPPKRKEQVSDSVEAIIANEVSEEWEDKQILDAYLQRIAVTEDEYTRFRNKSLSLDELAKIAYFADYVAQFRASARLRSMQNTTTFRRLSEQEQKERIKELFYQQQFDAEREKIYYFALVYKQNTLIISSPSNNDEQKRFLGYDWSNRRGNEGIQINNPGGMLYDDQNRNADYTLAAAVRFAYNDIQPHIPEREQYYVFARLQDMIDFTRPTFNKAIKTTPERKIIIRSKYPLVKLGSFAEIAKGKSITKAETKEGNVKVVAGGIDYAYLHNVANREANTITISASGANAGFVNFWREPIFASDCTTVRGRNEIETLFLYNFLQSIQDQIYYLQKGSAQPHVYPDDIADLQIPQVEDEKMQQIVTECAKVDEEYNTSRMTIEAYRSKIQQVFENLQVVGGKSLIIRRLGDVCASYIGLTYKPEDVTDDGILVLRSSNIQEGQLDLTDQVRVKNNIPERLYVKNGDVLVCVRNGSKRLLGKAAYIDNIEEQMTFGAFMAICRSDIGKWIYLWMQSKHYTDQLAKITATISINQLTQRTLLDLSIPVPSPADQQRIISQVEQYQAEIRKAKAIMNGCTARKKAILNKYLNQ